jgi:hypothetical protein
VQVSALRLALLTGAATAASFSLFYLWLRSPVVLALLGAALFGTLFMMVGASLGDDPVAADEAWRLEASDLADESSGVDRRDPRDELSPPSNTTQQPGAARVMPTEPPLDRPGPEPRPDPTA